MYAKGKTSTVPSDSQAREKYVLTTCQYYYHYYLDLKIKLSEKFKKYLAIL